ncbi:hypothetical protein SAMD00019534_088470 [Acytostelium subglobosum LB1]|uniref:hypothetical protein n=1 Tax=Acytostelium subglobosum LB1 TaxID=1410327 RepID=UPI00064484B2|nr:hypothetical protein SAMD00019534_088470 [Acytostelium subglobosum LB1]GAM25672.1 hypothetical protein SAMD00019534_088470 [Acytostelium subglobosum LB1]|eukprot:XP_012751190.1 hypothetical protein SAMD00019534_088470 [Acytostelium subglobosum LB1]
MNRYRLVVEQLEFYFSDSNLIKDKFLSKSVQQSDQGWISLDILLTFNKLTSMLNDLIKDQQQTTTTTTTTKDALIEVISSEHFVHNNNTLTTNEDKSAIKRKSPFVFVKELQQSIDERTIYIEPIAETATHEQVHQLLSTLGTIDNISIPRLPDKRTKGFAFVEFNQKQDAVNAIGTIRTNSDNRFNLRILSK